MASEHKHSWTMLWAHLGRFGRQDIHYHQCVADTRCTAMLFGPGRNCSGHKADHDLDRSAIPGPNNGSTSERSRPREGKSESAERPPETPMEGQTP